jgi:hypothetical protein
MTKDGKQIYFQAIKARYQKATRSEKAQILNEFCAVCGYNRKYAITKLTHQWVRRKKVLQKRGPKAIYQTKPVLDALKEIWMCAHFPCGKRFKSLLPLWLPHYPGLLNDQERQDLLKMSSATIDRLLQPYRIAYPKRGLCGTKPGTLLKQQIPIKCDHWDVTTPGFMEADTVAHCGNSLSGEFIWSITLTDIHSGWTENRAVWCKGSLGVLEQIGDIEANLPFAILGFDSDNGSEFLNHHLWAYFAKRQQPVGFTRSRPYHKNDNAHVEQKNWSSVRQLLGYERLEKQSALPFINQLYQKQWSALNNFFYPSMKLKSKIKVNSKYSKTYEDPMTPYQRLMASPALSENKKTQLKALFESLNPFVLQTQIQAQLHHISKISKVRFNMKQRITPSG